MKKNAEALKRELKESLLALKSGLKLFKSPNKTQVNLRELRILKTIPPVYLLTTDEFTFYQEKIFKCLVFTEDIELGTLRADTPFLLLNQTRTIIVALPLWIYCMENLLCEYTTKIGEIPPSKIEELVEYAEKTPIPETPQGVYIRAVAEFLSPLNTESLFSLLEHLEREVPQVIYVSDTPFEDFGEYQFPLTASSKRALRGKNWFAFIEEKENRAELFLYLPQACVGKTVKITLRDRVLFEGELVSDRLLFRDIPLFSDYSFLEEELHVQV